MNFPGLFGNDSSTPMRPLNIMHSLILNPNFLRSYGRDKMVIQMVREHKERINELLEEHAHWGEERTILIIPYPGTATREQSTDEAAPISWTCLNVTSLGNFSTDKRDDVPGLCESGSDPKFCSCCIIKVEQ